MGSVCAGILIEPQSGIAAHGDNEMAALPKAMQSVIGFEFFHDVIHGGLPGEPPGDTQTLAAELVGADNDDQSLAPGIPHQPGPEFAAGQRARHLEDDPLQAGGPLTVQNGGPTALRIAKPQTSIIEDENPRRDLVQVRSRRARKLLVPGLAIAQIALQRPMLAQLWLPVHIIRRVPQSLGMELAGPGLQLLVGGLRQPKTRATGVESVQQFMA